MEPEGQNNAAALEAFRRRGELGPPSAAGLPGANVDPGAVTGKQVMAERKLNIPQGPSMASQPGIQQMNQSRPGESELIIKGLIKHLERISGPQQSNASQTTTA